MKRYFDLLRSCAHCGQMFCEINLMCKNCWKILDREQNNVSNFRQWSYKLPTYSLYTWREQKYLESLIYGLKGGGLDEAFERLALRFLSLKYSLSNESYQKTIIVPAPASSPGARDHAYEWSFHLAQILGGEFKTPLLRGEVVPQKQLSREARLENKMSLSNNLDMARVDKIIFADDVITSGGTAWAAFEALGRPQNFEIWTIGCRPKKVLV